jgi:hypothetical protein
MGIAETMVEEMGIIKGMIVDMVDRALGIIEGDSLSVFLGFNTNNVDVCVLRGIKFLFMGLCQRVCNVDDLNHRCDEVT